MINESNVEFIIKPGKIYREFRLVPVAVERKPKYQFLGKIQRYTVRVEELICCLVSPDKKSGVFIDSAGVDYIISLKELQEKLTFVNVKYQKKIIPRFLFKRGSKESSAYWLGKFLSSPDVKKRYKGWISPNGVVGDLILEESFITYKEGKEIMEV